MNKEGRDMKYSTIIALSIFSSSLYANVGMNAKVGYGASTSGGETEGVFCYGTEIIYFSNMTLCGSVGYDAWHWSDSEGAFTASITNSSIVLSLGATFFPQKKPVASIRGGVGLVTWWKTSISGSGFLESDNESMIFKDFFGVVDFYVPICKNLDIVIQGKFAHQTLSIEESNQTYSQDWDTFSGKVGLQVIL
ncbi:MAG: hypothetical protein WBB37_01225 [bacterium]